MVCVGATVLGAVEVAGGAVVVGAGVFWTGAEAEDVGGIVVVGATEESVVEEAPI